MCVCGGCLVVCVCVCVCVYVCVVWVFGCECVWVGVLVCVLVCACLHKIIHISNVNNFIFNTRNWELSCQPVNIFISHPLIE